MFRICAFQCRSPRVNLVGRCLLLSSQFCLQLVSSTGFLEELPAVLEEAQELVAKKKEKVGDAIRQSAGRPGNITMCNADMQVCSLITKHRSFSGAARQGQAQSKNTLSV